MNLIQDLGKRREILTQSGISEVTEDTIKFYSFANIIIFLTCLIDKISKMESINRILKQGTVDRF
jgi:hypothetical protein